MFYFHFSMDLSEILGLCIILDNEVTPGRGGFEENGKQPGIYTHAED